jgi:hypothetical protein
MHLAIQTSLGLGLCFPSLWLLALSTLVASTPQSGIQVRQSDQIQCSGSGLALEDTHLNNLINSAAATKVVFSKTIYTGPLESNTPILPKFVMEWTDPTLDPDLIWAIAVQSTFRENHSTPIVNPRLWEYVSV